MTHVHREPWLQDGRKALEPVFAHVGLTIPEGRISCGACKGSSRIGEAWPPEFSEDNTPEIFISPKIADPMKVLATLLHECLHHAVGLEHGHKGPFRVKAKALGLEGKMTATHAGPELIPTLERISKELGPYPHAPLIPQPTTKKNKNRHHKMNCAMGCGFSIRTSRGAIEEYGPPVHCGDEPMVWDEGGKD